MILLTALLTTATTLANTAHADPPRHARVTTTPVASWRFGDEEAAVVSVMRGVKLDPLERSSEHVLIVKVRSDKEKVTDLLLTATLLAAHGISFREMKSYLEDPQIAISFDMDRLGWGTPKIRDFHFHPDCEHRLDSGPSEA